MSIYRMQLTALPCHGSGRELRQAGNASGFQPEPRQAIPQLMRETMARTLRDRLDLENG